jgi:predicted CXXCH cytochrome family protein
MEGGPFLYEHAPTSSFATEGGDGCIACHQPHGSSNERLLVRPDNLLCKQCHSTPALHFTQHGGIGTMFDCMECHNSVHGSNDNQRFLDPNLGAKIGMGAGACFCHNVSG